MNIDPIKIFTPPVIAAIFFILAWASDRSIAGGELTPHMKRVLVYGSLFVLGLGYLILWQDEVDSLFHWSSAWIFLISIWAVALFGDAWFRYRTGLAEPNADRKAAKSASTLLAEGAPALGLIISLPGCMIEWEYILRGEGKWWVGLLWIGAISTCIFAARNNRRSTVVTVLRGLVVLLAIGAATERTQVAISVAILSGIGLLLVEKIWHIRSKH